MPRTAWNDSVFGILISTAVDGIIVTDKYGTIEICNAACETLFKYSPEEALGKNVKMLMPSPYREGHDGDFEHHRRMGERRIISVGREVVGQRKEGTTFPMYLSFGEGIAAGERIYVGIIDDLTLAQRDVPAYAGLAERIAACLAAVRDGSDDDGDCA